MFEKQESPATRWSARLASFALVLFLTAALAHRYLALETVAFLWVLGLVGLLALVALGAAVSGLLALWEHGGNGAGRLIFAIILAGLTLAPFGVGLWRMIEYPRLADIATDLVEPPRFRAAAILRDPRANAIGPINGIQAALIEDTYPQVDGRRYPLAPDRVLETIQALMARRGWAIIERRGNWQQDREVTIEALAGSYLLLLPADVAVRITDEGETTFVDMRSASHFGAHDLGDNALRIMRFLADLDAMVAADAAPG
ncbi:MAG: DUF1499 domain-containing protein [Nitratireductor sp.]